MERTNKIGEVALCESQKFDNKSPSKLTIIGLFLFFDKCFEIYELISCQN